MKQLVVDRLTAKQPNEVVVCAPSATKQLTSDVWTGRLLTSPRKQIEAKNPFQALHVTKYKTCLNTECSKSRRFEPTSSQPAAGVSSRVKPAAAGGQPGGGQQPKPATTRSQKQPSSHQAATGRAHV